jgi:hypothetical protein
MHKMKSFEHEKDVRLVWTRWAEMLFGNINAFDKKWRESLPRGCPVSVSIGDLTLEGFVPPKSEPWFRDLNSSSHYRQ